MWGDLATITREEATITSEQPVVRFLLQPHQHVNQQYIEVMFGHILKPYYEKKAAKIQEQSAHASLPDEQLDNKGKCIIC